MSLAYDIGTYHARLAESVADTVGALGKELDAELEASLKKIREANYSERVMEREVSTLMHDHADRMWEALGANKALARTLAAQYQQGYVEAAQRKIKRPRPPTTFPGDKILAREIAHKQPRPMVSRDLHRKATKATRQIVSEGMTAVREAKHLTEAATKLIHVVEVRSGTGTVGAGIKKSGLVEDLERAGRNLNARGGKKALKEWKAVRKRLQRYIPRLDESGRTRSSFIELLQNTSDTSAKGIDRALRQHAAFKQKYVSERIVRTETALQFKREQFARDAKHKWIVGYTWRMMRAARKAYVKRTPLPKRGKRRTRCVCEMMDSTRVSIERAKSKPMGHPHCMCFFEPIFNLRMMDQVA